MIPADGMARGLTYPVAPEQIIVAAKSLFTCCVSFHAAAFVCRLVRSGCLLDSVRYSLETDYFFMVFTFWLG